MGRYATWPTTKWSPLGFRIETCAISIDVLQER